MSLIGFFESIQARKDAGTLLAASCPIFSSENA